MVSNSHYKDACVTALQMESGNFKGDAQKDVINRLLYNTSFSKTFPNLIGNTLSEEEKKKWSDFWKTTYGFNPENE